MRGKYIPVRRLKELDNILSDRDKEMLNSLKKCRYLMTGQIGRLHCEGNANPTARLRAANRAMNKLQGYKLAESIQRRIGGVRAGGGSYVWTLTESGVYLLNLNNLDCTKRRRSFEPSLNFLEHTLEVSETYVQLTEICRRHRLELVKAEMEPSCWRSGYTGADGKPATMKPDMFAITDDDEYLNNWFIEIDLNTESSTIVLEKCRRYIHYCNSGLEQKQHGVFPLVVWLVYNPNRKAKLQQYIADCREMTAQQKSIFTVIMPGEFETLITGGVAALNEEKGEQIA